MNSALRLVKRFYVFAFYTATPEQWNEISVAATTGNLGGKSRPLDGSLLLSHTIVVIRIEMVERDYMF